MIRVSKELQQFYKEIEEWVKTGCVSYEFRKQVGLCGNLAAWAEKRFPSSLSVQHRVISEQYLLFVRSGLCSTYPFNSASGRSYDMEADDHELYKNPERLAWICKYAGAQ